MGSTVNVNHNANFIEKNFFLLSPDLLVVTDNQGNIFASNPTFKTIFENHKTPLWENFEGDFPKTFIQHFLKEGFQLNSQQEFNSVHYIQPFTYHIKWKGMCLAEEKNFYFRGLIDKKTDPNSLPNPPLKKTVNDIPISELPVSENLIDLSVFAPESLVKLVLNGNVGLYYLLDKNYKILAFNQAAAQSVGVYWKKELQPGTNFMELIPADTQENFKASFSEACTGKHVIVERMVNVGAKTLWTKSHYRPLFNKNGVFQAMAFIIEDTTEQKIREKSFEYISDTVDAIFWIYNHKTKQIEHIDHKFKEITGIDTQRVYNDPSLWETFTHPEDHERIKETFQTVYEQKSDAHFEIRIIDKNSQIKWLKGFLSLENDHLGDLCRFVGICSDISNQISTEQKLKESLQELQYQKYALDASALVAVCDKEFNTIQVNDKLCSKTGYTKNELLNNQSLKLISEEVFVDNFPEVIQAIKEEGQVWVGEIKKNTKEGKSIYLKTTIVPFINTYGKVEKYVMVMIDITRRKISEENLIKRNFELDSFTYSISHDVRAPLASVLGLVTLIQMNDVSPLVKEYAEHIERSITKLDKFVQSVLSYSKTTSQLIEKTKINFKKIIKECKEELSEEQNYVKINFSIDITLKEKYFSDELAIKTIFKNLFDNSIKFINPSITTHFIKINIKQVSQNIIIKFEDNGVGIERKYLPDIFRMFFKGSNLSAGSGLGLYVVKLAVERLNGIIEVDSELGKGTIFTIMLPNKASHLK
jgi:PAS domain S-box-containing protein